MTVSDNPYHFVYWQIINNFMSIHGWQYRELMKLNIPQDDLNLILGGNAIRMMGLEDKVPHTRFFKQYLRGG